MKERRVRLVALAMSVAMLVPIALGHASGDPAPEPLLDERRASIFHQTCARCHVRPGLGVPVLGDGAEWPARRARGFDSLMARTVDGFGGMPPLGTCSFCSEDDLRRLVAFTAGYSAVPTTSEARP